MNRSASRTGVITLSAGETAGLTPDLRYLRDPNANLAGSLTRTRCPRPGRKTPSTRVAADRAKAPAPAHSARAARHASLDRAGQPQVRLRPRHSRRPVLH